MRSPLIIAVLVGGCLASGCAHSHRSADSPDPSAPYETFNEDNYSNVPSYGEGSETSTGYYGTGSKPPETTPEHTPATPSARQHRPY